MATNICIFASGGGSNAESIIQHFKSVEDIKIKLIVSNKPNAFVLQRAKNHQIDSLIIERNEFKNSDAILEKLQEHRIDFIVLAGFLWLIPLYLIQAFPKRILNIHPALLPKYGGKGMYGHHVHQAVFNNFEKESGMTIHEVNENYDEGAIVFQAKTTLDPSDTAEDIAAKVLKLEHAHYPQVIEEYIRQLPTD